MINQKFAIIDIETTGGIARRDKITEIGIIIIQNNDLIDQFESLINPERSIPPEITRITGITNEMVATAPKFYELAKTITLLTSECIFVAHNVSFDYGFIKEEFAQLGYSYSRKKLCTLQMARRQFKGLSSYSLGNLIKHFDIKVAARHRAMEDCIATVELFKKLLADEKSNKPLSNFLSDLLKNSKYPSNLVPHDIKSLPEFPGVYYMKDKNNVPIYIGKSKNIKERIMQHFNDAKPKTKKMLDLVHTIEYKICANDLIACLLESQEIKFHQPEINKALRKKSNAYYLTVQLKQNSFSRLSICAAEWLTANDTLLMPYSTRTEAKEHLNLLIDEFNLCFHVNEGHDNLKPCYKFQFKKCNGACTGLESIEAYNKRVEELCKNINGIFTEDFVLYGPGYNEEMQSVVIVEHGYCTFYGSIQNSIEKPSLPELKSILEQYSGEIDSNRIIRQALKNSFIYQKMLINK